MNRMSQWTGWVALAGWLAVSGPVWAQKGLTLEAPTLVGFKAPINEGNRMVALVSGSEAKPSLAAGQVEVKGFRLETYRYNPDRAVELVAESPLGVFGPSGAVSDQKITLSSSDGRFSIAGVGWGWDKTTGLLVISNRVETRLRRPGVATNRPPVEVRAQRFEYHLTQGDARFVGDCEAVDAGQARLRAGLLMSRLSVRVEKPDAIVATNGVTLELLRPGRQGRAAAAAATYASGAEGGDTIELTGSPTWAFGPGEGSADRLVLRPAADAYSAEGSARLKLRRPAKSAPEAAVAAAGAAKAAGAEPLEIACERIDGTPREVVFTGPVTAKQAGRLELRAARVVTALEPATETREARPTLVSATGGVWATLRSGTGPVVLRGETMRYALGEHDVVEVEGGPSWEAVTHRGQAERFVIHPEVPIFQATGAVKMSWQMAGARTNGLPVDVEADRMVVEPAEARFTGSVRARRGGMDLRSAEAVLGLATNAAPRELLAKGGVKVDYPMPPEPGGTNRLLQAFYPPGTPLTEASRHWAIEAREVRAGLSGAAAEPSSLEATGGVSIRNPGVTATGEELRYSAGDGFLRLTGDARMRAASGMEIVAEPATPLAFHPRTLQFQVEGRWRRMVMPTQGLRGGGGSGATNRLDRIGR